MAESQVTNLLVKKQFCSSLVAILFSAFSLGVVLPHIPCEVFRTISGQYFAICHSFSWKILSVFTRLQSILVRFR